MKELGVELIFAKSPQAKGRVERSNRTLQDRLIKALRREGISNIAEVNNFLQKKFIKDLLSNLHQLMCIAQQRDIILKIFFALRQIDK